MPATAAGTAEPTARNLDATAMPQDWPSSERATIEKVMGANGMRSDAREGKRRALWNVPSNEATVSACELESSPAAATAPA
jgi:hypothetical protein